MLKSLSAQFLLQDRKRLALKVTRMPGFPASPALKSIFLTNCRELCCRTGTIYLFMYCRANRTVLIYQI